MLNKQIQPSLANINLEELLKFYHAQLNMEALDYLKERGINQKTIEDFLIGFEKDQIGFQLNSNYTGFFRNRIIFPLISMNGDIVDLIGRSIDGKEPKFKSFIGIEETFFNEKAIQSSEDVVLCNSIFDVLSLEQANIPGICMVNNQINNDQINKLNGKRVFLCFGNDEIGRRETIRTAKSLADNVKELYIIHLPEGIRDINDFFLRVQNPLEEFINLINLTLKENLTTPITPDSSYLIHFQEEFTKRQKGKLKGIESGFKALDELLIGGFQEGLYLVAGDVSVGKTSFLKQLADQMAKDIPVIFISWDMSSFELWVRTMSRVTGFSSQSIFSGKAPMEGILEANQAYANIARNIWTIDADFDTSLEDVANVLNKILQTLNKKPVIILDHLQRIHLRKAQDIPAKDLQLKISYNIHNWSRQWGIPILLATTGNEQNMDHDLLATVDGYLLLSKANEMGILQLEILKNRNGNLGRIKMKFDSKIGLFSEYSKNIN